MPVRINRVVLASNNAGKLVELQTLFTQLHVELVTQRSVGVNEVDEPHHTFLENGLRKARHASAASGLPALADDSGLCVDALGGLPGVASAHFAQVDGADGDGGDREAQRRVQDEANNRLLLQRLHAVHDRRARFVCTLVAVRSANDPEPLVARGALEGTILLEPKGHGGFGYDPLFWVAAQGQTAAELSMPLRNQLSHRAAAARAMLALMRQAWRLGDCADTDKAAV